MNRKDTILVAVLVNIGVLLILFVSALKPHAQPEWQATQPVDSIANETKAALARVESKPIENKNDAIPKEFSQAIEQLLKLDEPNEKHLAAEAAPVEKVMDSSLLAHEVKAGEVLEKIAKTSGITVDEIKKINQLNDDKLQIGQVLYVPQAQTQKTAALTLPVTQPAAKTTQTHSEDRYYTVKNGDSPWTIATKNHMKVEELLRLNGLDEAKAKKIKPGDRLRIK